MTYLHQDQGEPCARPEMRPVDNPYSEATDCPICPMLATDRDDALNNFQSLAESYDALVANSSAEHQRMSELLQALSTNVTRLDEEKEQDRRTIDYWKGQFERREDDYARLYAQCEDIKEQYRDCARDRDRFLARLRTMFGITSGTDAEEAFLVVERYDAANLRTIDSLRDHVAMHAKLGRLAHGQAEQWQAMAELLWEELQEWHYDECPDQRQAGCICHRILAAKWDEITNANDWADDDEADS